MKIRSALHYIRPYYAQLMTLVALTMIGSIVLLAVPWLAGQLIGGILLKQASNGHVFGLLLGALVILASIGFFTSVISATTTSRVLADLRVRIYAHLQELPLRFHEDRRQGDILALATFEVARLGNFLTGTLVSLPSRLFTAIGAVILMYRIDKHLALLVPALVPAFFITLKLVGRRLRAIALASQQAEAEVVALVEENLTMLPAIKSFAREDLETARYKQSVRRAMRLAVQQGRVQAGLEPAVGLISAIAVILLLFIAGRTANAGIISNAQMFSFLFYAALLTRPVGTLAHLYGEIQMARGTLARVESVLNESIEPGYSGRLHLRKAQGRVEFVGVTFSYPDRDPLLSDLSLDILAGEKVALVGSNGAGKTTLLNLLMGFIVPASGSIRIDGADIATLDVRDLRRQIGLVPQRALLYNGTIRANIAYGSVDTNDDEVIRAARIAQAYDFITALPDGFNTQIGDHGVRLSGGQRQRLSLARALINNPPILLFDEATSMYDIEGEDAFVEASTMALRGRTVLFTTHRPASLTIADRVVCVEAGTARELVPPSKGPAAESK